MPLILSGNVASATAAAYEVANSCRFDDGSSTEMNKTISSTSTTWTFSCWIKLNPTGTIQYLASWDMGSGESLGIGIEASTNQLFIYTTSTAAAPKLYDGKLRDPSAWMNIVIKKLGLLVVGLNYPKFLLVVLIYFLLMMAQISVQYI